MIETTLLLKIEPKSRLIFISAQNLNSEETYLSKFKTCRNYLYYKNILRLPDKFNITYWYMLYRFK